jgi:nicotinamidase-related amidase
MAFDPPTTAILLIEYQNEFASKGGVLHGAVEGVMAETNMLANTVALVSEARKRGVTILHAPISFAPGYGELTRHPYGILKGVVDGKAFVKGTWGAEIIDALLPSAGDIVIEGKRGLDAFASTNLDFITLTDCLAATSSEAHKNALKYDFPMFSKPMPSAEVLGHLRA